VGEHNSRWALVTGASRGIGAAIAKQLAVQGINVIGTATQSVGVEKIIQMLSGYPVKTHALVLDVSDLTSIENGLSKIAAEFPSIDILVNNAGVTRDNLLLRAKTEDWDQLIQTNLSSVFHLSKALIKNMSKNRWGRIISLSSVVASTGNPGQTNYAAAKAGLEGFSRSLAREMARRGITVNVVAPGYIQTDMTAVLDETQQQAIAQTVPAGRMGLPEDIAHAVGFLASEQAGYINGQVLHVNGGMYM
jgi:3-oxoacyl-[acyl-carrier protein] reductase